MKKITITATRQEIIYLFLKKLELLTTEERKALINSIKLIQTPIFSWDKNK